MPTQQNPQNNEPNFSMHFANTVDDLFLWNEIALKEHRFYKYRNFANFLLLILLDIVVFSFFIKFISFYASLAVLALVPFQIYIQFKTKLGKSFSLDLRKTILMPKIKAVAQNSEGFLQEREMTFYEDKIVTNYPDRTGERLYSSIIDLVETSDYLFLKLSKLQALILPKKYLTNDQIEFIKSKVTAANSKI